MIPKNIFQTHKSMKYVLSNPKFVVAMNSWKRNGYSHDFYDDQKCFDFMRDHFYGDVFDCYCRLPMAVMKADLWRYCVIYKFGGIYADIDTISKYTPNIFINETLLCIAPENNTHLCQWVFAAPSQSPILKSIIDLSVERIKSMNEIKGEHIVHYLTGPGLFTDGIEKYLRENNHPTFEDKKSYFQYPNSNVLKVFNHDNFHKNVVLHLFAGQCKDGWFYERFKKLL